MDKQVTLTQAALLSNLLDAIIFKCHQKSQARDIDARGIVNLLWAMAKLVDNGQKQTPEFNDTVAALLPHIHEQTDQFIPQHIANLLWAMAKLVDNGQEWTPALNKAVTTLLPHVKAQKANFQPQGIANLLWAMAKLVENGQEQTSGLKEAVAALLSLVKAQKANFKPQGITNLLWAMAKLMDNEHWTAKLKEAVAVLLPYVNAQKDQFTPQHIANLLWAMAKLVDNGQELISELKKAMAALLPHVKAHKDHFTPQHIANLMWALEKLGELVELNVVTSTFETLVCISENSQFSQQTIMMSLWGVMVCCTRLSLVANANKNHVLEKHMGDLFTRVQNTSQYNEEDQRSIAMAANWLGRACPVVPHYQTIISKPQSDFRNQLQSGFNKTMY
ncbi:DUF1601 domain-containing protein [Endozoicomonas sp. ALB115]